MFFLFLKVCLRLPNVIRVCFMEDFRKRVRYERKPFRIRLFAAWYMNNKGINKKLDKVVVEPSSNYFVGIMLSLCLDKLLNPIYHPDIYTQASKKKHGSDYTSIQASLFKWNSGQSC